MLSVQHSHTGEPVVMCFIGLPELKGGSHCSDSSNSVWSHRLMSTVLHNPSHCQMGETKVPHYRCK